jgi:photosystem II stability/assembly factor-like uncharacterized protein
MGARTGFAGAAQVMGEKAGTVGGASLLLAVSEGGTFLFCPLSHPVMAREMKIIAVNSKSGFIIGQDLQKYFTKTPSCRWKTIAGSAREEREKS